MYGDIGSKSNTMFFSDRPADLTSLLAQASAMLNGGGGGLAGAGPGAGAGARAGAGAGAGSGGVVARSAGGI